MRNEIRLTTLEPAMFNDIVDVSKLNVRSHSSEVVFRLKELARINLEYQKKCAIILEQKEVIEKLHAEVSELRLRLK
jgi:hypothetical protein